HPVLPTAANSMNEIANDLSSPWRVNNLGMKLNAEHPPAPMFDRSIFRVFRDGDRLEAGWQTGQSVAMRIPDLKFRWQSPEERRGIVRDRQQTFAIFALETSLDFAAQIMRQQLQPITNAQDRNAQTKHRAIGQWRVRAVHARRTSRQNDA